ncbi:MAG: tRNA lysidine(34) synthetase TilS, partial [Candidatus Binatia bacterium]
VRRSVGRLRWIGENAERREAPPTIELRVGDERSFGEFRLRARHARGRSAGRPTHWRALFDAESVSAVLVVRAPRPGDRIRPHGLGGTKKLQDVFVDAGVERERRADYPVVVAGEEIVWVPGLVRGEAALLTANTRHVLAVECMPAR